MHVRTCSLTKIVTSYTIVVLRGSIGFASSRLKVLVKRVSQFLKQPRLLAVTQEACGRRCLICKERTVQK